MYCNSKENLKMLFSCLGYRLRNPQPHLLDIARADVTHVNFLLLP